MKINQKKRIGIMGGTFDPIHNGHLLAAEWVKEQIFLEEIIFIPTGKPAHKTGKKVLSGAERLNILELAISDNDSFKSSNIEINREGITYSYDTVCSLKEEFGHDIDIYFIIGTDTLLDIHSWFKAKELLNAVTFVAVTRPGVDVLDVVIEIDRLEAEKNAKILTVEIPDMGMSSTLIRNRIIENKSIKYLVPDNVIEYIYSKGLYKNELL